MVDIKVKNLTPMFGVEVSGVKPRVPLDEKTCQALKTLFDEKSLLLFRDLEADMEFQSYLSEMLIGGNALSPDAPPPLEFYVSNKRERAGAPTGRLLFHTDMMWVENGCQCLSLYGYDVEQPAIPTLFISSACGWDTLPDDLRARIQGRTAVHCQDATTQRKESALEGVLVSTFENEERLALPVGYRHPRTGRTLLYVCPQMTYNIQDMPSSESEALLEELFDHLYAPEVILEHHWRKRDLVVWDNIALQHARPNVSDRGPARTLRKSFAPVPKYARGGTKVKQSVRSQDKS